MENIVFIFAILLCNGVSFIASSRQDPSVNIETLVNNYGYAFEVHNVITEDGYILELHRISGVINKPLSETKNKKVALLLHGLVGSSATWLFTGPKRTLALILVDNGYDVWLLNNRGSTYSRKHVSKLEASYGFWDFSWHEMGTQDLPATMDYVLNNTNESNLNANLEHFLKYEPAGSSCKQLLHYGLGKYYPGTFRLYDYGSARNLRLYNSITPPDYPLEKVDIPFAIYHGQNDLLAHPGDIDLLKGRLPNIVDAYLIPGKLNHYDLILGLNINKLCYKRALALMEKYN